MNDYTIVVGTMIPPGGEMITLMNIQCEEKDIQKTFERAIWDEHNSYEGCDEPSQEEIDEAVVGNHIILVFPGKLDALRGIGVWEGA
jgi:hypothetical protein